MDVELRRVLLFLASSASGPIGELGVDRGEWRAASSFPPAVSRERRPAERLVIVCFMRKVGVGGGRGGREHALLLGVKRMTVSRRFRFATVSFRVVGSCCETGHLRRLS